MKNKSLASTLFGLFLLLLVIVLQNQSSWRSDPSLPPHTQVVRPAKDGYFFCFWNVENFFDDKFDGRTGLGDKEYDPWYANHPDLLEQKLGKMCEALLKMNEGKGPDILAIAEVESVRAAELLKDALNAKLSDKNLHYQNVVMKEITVGRHIAPAILTRLPVDHARTRQFDKRFRVIQAGVVVEGKELIIFASHWTSRIKDSGVKGRTDYADKIYGACNAMYLSNPNVDILVCGDFNDTPSDVSVVDHLHSVGDPAQARGSNPLKLFNLMANRDPKEFGTHYYSGKWFQFDQIVVSPGMLGRSGWSCDPGSLQVVNSLAKPGDRLRRPWHFGNEREKGQRGYSDHFPVTARLRFDRAAPKE